MKKKILHRIKWEKLTISLCALACASVWVYGAVEPILNPPVMIEYRKEVAEGETIWDICSRIATNEDDLNRLVWRTCKENGIENPGELQPGREIIIRVERKEK